MTAPLQNGGAVTLLHTRAPAAARAPGSAAAASNGERTPDRARTVLLPKLATASSGAPISGVVAFFGGVA